MSIQLKCILAALFATLFLNACATSPEVDQQRKLVDTELTRILGEPIDEELYGKPKRCISDHEYRSFEALDERHILFEGRNDKQWVSTLPSRCNDLRHGDILRVRSHSTIGKICERDSFAVDDWFDWPWYKRWPWSWGDEWSSGLTCTMGKIQPVTAAQLSAIKDIMGK